MEQNRQTIGEKQQKINFKNKSNRNNKNRFSKKKNNKFTDFRRFYAKTKKKLEQAYRTESFIFL